LSGIPNVDPSRRGEARPGQVLVDMPVEVGNERGRVHAWKAAASTLIKVSRAGGPPVFEGQQVVALSRSKYWSGPHRGRGRPGSGAVGAGSGADFPHCVQQVEWPRGLEHVGVGFG
jgi:hypothetical protein